MRFSRGATVRFHFACAGGAQTPFTRSALKMSRLYSPLPEIADVLVRFDHVASLIVNTNNSVM
jgi:hypothetical protein